jgi:hypothetical protein
VGRGRKKQEIKMKRRRNQLKKKNRIKRRVQASAAKK